MLLNEALRVSPFKRSGDPLLFPFLVFQPKSAKSEDFASINKPTASSIQTLLNMQADLQEECEQRKNWQEGPLVSFLSNRGKDWRLAACFVDNTNGYVCFSAFCLKNSLLTSYQCMSDLWNGALHPKDGELQLLLIIDRAIDWARDIYRPAIIRHLEYLSIGDASSDCFDSSPSPPARKSKTRSSSARRRNLRNPSSRRQKKTQHFKKGNDKWSTPTRHGSSSVRKKPQHG